MQLELFPISAIQTISTLSELPLCLLSYRYVKMVRIVQMEIVRIAKK